MLHECSSVTPRRASTTTRCARGSAGAQRFVSVHVLVPPDWTVQRGHDLLERIEADIRRALPPVTVLTHLEPLGDPAAMADQDLHREDDDLVGARRAIRTFRARRRPVLTDVKATCVADKH